MLDGPTFCIDRDPGGFGQWIEALSFCAERGLRLCAPDESMAACTITLIENAGDPEPEYTSFVSGNLTTQVFVQRSVCDSSQAVLIGDSFGMFRCCISK